MAHAGNRSFTAVVPANEGFGKIEPEGLQVGIWFLAICTV